MKIIYLMAFTLILQACEGKDVQESKPASESIDKNQEDTDQGTKDKEPPAPSTVNLLKDEPKEIQIFFDDLTRVPPGDTDPLAFVGETDPESLKEGSILLVAKENGKERVIATKFDSSEIYGDYETHSYRYFLYKLYDINQVDVGDGKNIVVRVTANIRSNSGHVQEIKEYPVVIVMREPSRAEKPVIYLYPEVPMEIHVQLLNPEVLTFTYPLYNLGIMGWKVHAEPSGLLRELGGQRTFNYLFWEGLDPTVYPRNVGSLVVRKQVVSFLEEKLTLLGLHDREANEFITFWAPLMEKYEKVQVYFAGKEYEDYAPLVISPKPDSLLRVYMVWNETELQEGSLEPQTLTPFKRTGFSVVEWGGTERSLK